METLRRLLFLLMCSLLALGCGGGGGDGQEIPTDACNVLGLTPKIFNGTQCEDATSPVVRLRILFSNASEGLCTATMITRDAALSAAHCFLSGSLQAVFVERGETSIFAPRVIVPTNVSTDPQSGIITNDVAVVSLSAPIEVTPIALVANEQVSGGNLISVFGYGLNETGAAETLRSGFMEVEDVSSTHISANFNGEGSNVCNGDSGGPAIRTIQTTDGRVVPAIVGVTSTGRLGLACQPGDTTLFTNICSPDIQSFLQEVIPAANRVQ